MCFGPRRISFALRPTLHTAGQHFAFLLITLVIPNCLDTATLLWATFGFPAKCGLKREYNTVSKDFSGETHQFCGNLDLSMSEGQKMFCFF
jgi:hypothetical protein